MATRKKAEVVAVPKAPVVLLTPKEIAEKMRAKFIEAASATANDVVADQVVESITDDLNKQKREVTLRLLGLDNRWGKWEVDHCNGRESPITKYLTAQAANVIAAWVNDAVKEVLTTEMQAKIMRDAKGAIRKELNDLVQNATAGYHLNQRAKPFLDDLMQKAADEVREELGLPKHTGDE